MSDEKAIIARPRLAYHPMIQERFGVDQADWRALIDAVWPAAKTAEAIVLALSYCKARKLDPFKRPIHIVPVWNKALGKMVEGIWPGIGELRTTAFRTGLYGGRDKTEYGPDIEEDLGGVRIKYPQWCEITVYRLGPTGKRMPFPGPRVYWIESYATANNKTDAPNDMWKRRPYGQVEKVAEAAALRAAFPEEIGHQLTADEMEGQVIDSAGNVEQEAVAKPLPKNKLQAFEERHNPTITDVEPEPDLTPHALIMEHDEPEPEIIEDVPVDEIAADGNLAAKKGLKALQDFWKQIGKTERLRLSARLDGWKKIAAESDEVSFVETEIADAEPTQDEAAPVYEVWDNQGVLIYFGPDPKDAGNWFITALDKAGVVAGEKGMNTVWENNASLMNALEMNGHEALSKELSVVYGKRREALAASQAVAEAKAAAQAQQTPPPAPRQRKPRAAPVAPPETIVEEDVPLPLGGEEDQRADFWSGDSFTIPLPLKSDGKTIGWFELRDRLMFFAEQARSLVELNNYETDNQVHIRRFIDAGMLIDAGYISAKIKACRDQLSTE